MTVNSSVSPLVTIAESANPVCAGTPVTFTAIEISEGGIAPVFQWRINGMDAEPASGSQVFSATLDNNDQVSVIMTSSVDCAVGPAISNTITVVVNPRPHIVEIPTDKIYCNGQLTISSDLSGNPSPVSFDISGGSGIGLPDQAGVTAIPAFTALAGTATITVIPKTIYCVGDAATFNITVNPEPVAQSPGNLSFCNGIETSPLPLSGSPSGVVFNISGGTSIGLADLTGTTAIPSFSTIAGTAEITVIPVANGCIGQPVRFNITVFPTPHVTAPPDQTLCNSVLTTPVLLSGSPAGVSFNVTGGNVIGLTDQSLVAAVPAFNPVTGSAVILLTPVANGCAGPPSSFNITVNPTPVANSIPDQTYCSGAITTPVPITGMPSGVLFDISGGTSIGLPDISGVNTIPAFTPVEGSATITVIPRANGCTGSSAHFSIRVNPNLPVSVSITSNANPVCAGTPVTFTATAVNGGAIPSYQWNVNGVASGTNSPVFTYTPVNADQVSLTLNSSNACTTGNPASSNIIITNVFTGVPGTPSAPVPRPGQSNSMCPPAEGLQYSTQPVANATGYTWNFPAGWTITQGQGTTSVTVTAGTQTTGDKNITVSAVNPCGSSVSQPLTVTVGSFASVNAGPDQTVCAGTASVQMNGSIGGATGRNDWYWSAPIGSFSQIKKLDATYNIPASIINGGSVIISMTARAEGSCPFASDEMTIDIRPAPSASVSIAGNNPVCSGTSSAVQFTGTPGTIITYRINAGANQTIPLDGSGSALLSTPSLNINTTYNLISIAYSSGLPCTRTISGSATITVNQPVSVNAGPDQVVCVTNPAVILAGSIGNGAISGSWNGGTGSFAPGRAALNATYTPSAQEIAAGGLTLTLVTNDPAGPCEAVSDQVIITINPQPVVNAGASQTICAGSATTLDGSLGGSATSATWSGGSGTFSPGPATLNAVYTPGAADNSAGGVTLTLTSNDPPGPCNPATSQVRITINPRATANAGADQVICGGSSVLLAGATGGGAATGTWSGGTGTFADPNSLNTVYTPGAGDISSGSVTLMLTTDDPAGPCTAVSDQVIITINTQPIVNAGPDQTICAGSPVTLAGTLGGTATSGTWSGGNGSFSPNANTLNAVYNPGAGEITSGFVILTLTTNDPAGVCTAVTDQVAITINPAATVSAGASQIICSNASATLAGVVGGGASGGVWSGGTGTFIPDRSTLNASYTPSPAERTAGSVTLTLSTNDPAGPCGPVSSSTTLTIRRAVQITTQPSNIGVCASYPATFNVVATGDQLSYQWYKGSIPGTPVVNSSNISGATTASLHFNQANISDDGAYYVAVSGAPECSTVTSGLRTLNVDQAISITTQPLSATQCTGATATFSVVANANGDPLAYQWRKNGIAIPGATSSTLAINNISASDAGSYDVIISGTAGYMCSSSQSSAAVLTVIPSVTMPVFSAGSSSVRCQGAGSLTYTASSTNFTALVYTLDAASVAAGNSINPATGNVTYTAGWSGTSIITATASGCGGPLSATHTVTVNSLSAGGTISPSNSIICSGAGAGTLTLTGYNGTILNWEYSTDGGLTWLTIPNASNTYTPAISQTTAYRAVVRNGNCAQAYSNPAIVSIIPLSNPVITSSPQPPVICFGQSVTLFANNGPMDGPVFDGSFSNANPTGWCRDQQCTGDFLPAHRDNETTGPWGETNGPKDFEGILYSSQSGKFAVAGGSVVSRLETPVFSLFGNPPATLFWRDAFYLINGATARVEISINGGSTYTTLTQYSGISGNYQNFRQEQIDLTQYLGQPYIRIRFTFTGTAGSSWAIDDVRITPLGAPPVVNYSWTANPGPFTATGDTITVTPTVTTVYTLTTSITTPYGTCPLGTSNITVTVNQLPVCSITGTDGPTCPLSVNSFTAPAGMRRYTWSITGNGTITAGASNQTVTVRSGSVCNASFTLTLAITDNNGCTNTCLKTITVSDNIQPIITGCVPDMTFCEVAGNTYTIPPLTGITDNCGLPTSISYQITGATTRNGSGNASGLFSNGVSTITWYVTDTCGNNSSCTTTITINPAPVTSPIYHR